MATLASLLVELDIDTDALRAGVRRATDSLKKLSGAVASVGVGAPALAAVGVAVGGMAAAFASAGAAAAAFQVAAGPQLEAVAEAATAAEAAEKAHEKATLKSAQAQKLAAKGGDEYKKALRESKAATDAAREADAAYEQQLAALPPATRAMSKELQGLKDDHKKWSDELSSTTMPVFTKGIAGLRKALPLLTPLVKAASGAFSEFLDEIARSAGNGGLKSFADSLAKIAGRNLKALLMGMKNITVGVAGVIRAFSSMSGSISGGFEDATKAFADWGMALKDSEGFAKFVELAKSGAATLKTLATAAGNLLVAMGPLIGITVDIAKALADMINALPPGVLEKLVMAVAAVVVGLKVYAAAAAVAATATRIMGSTAFIAVRGWLAMNALGIKAMLGVAATAVKTAATTAAAWAGAALRSMAVFAAQMIRTAAVAVAQFAMMAARAIVWAATMAAQWLIAMGPIGWVIAIVIALVVLIIANWDKIKKWTGKAWDWVSKKVSGAMTTAKKALIAAAIAILNWVSTKWNQVKNLTSRVWNWIKSSISNAIRDAARAVVRKVADILRKIRGIKGSVTSALRGAGTWLLRAGKRVVQGFIDGITGMFSSVRQKLSQLTSMLPDWKGPLTLDKKILTPNGKAVINGFMKGVADRIPALRRQLRKVTGDLPGYTSEFEARGVSGTALMRSQQSLRLDVTGADGEMKQLVRKLFRVDGRGFAQIAPAR